MLPVVGRGAQVRVGVVQGVQEVPVGEEVPAGLAGPQDVLEAPQDLPDAATGGGERV